MEQPDQIPDDNDILFGVESSEMNETTSLSQTSDHSNANYLATN